ncbi:MAG: PAS domain S-box protein [Deltaproteobacteria bacterium]|nr:PAS domain S-box protein [Deltaproteobacteria bacterium]
MNRDVQKKSKRLSFSEDLIENLPVGLMILNDKGKILRMNKKQEEISQIQREKVVGKTFAEAFPKTLDQGLEMPYFDLLTKKRPFNILIDRYLPQYYEQQMTYRARGTPFSSGKKFILVHELERELYREKRLVEARTSELHESKNFLRSMIDSSPNIVISTDLEGRILVLNKTAENIFGFRKQEAFRKDIHFLLDNLPKACKRNKESQKTASEVLCRKKNGATFPASLLTADVKTTGGKTIAKLYLLNDLTEKKAMEERLFLSEKLALYSELMGGIAHQLNNPLIGVVNFSEMLLKEMEEGCAQKELALTISRAGKECLKIITSVLNCIKEPQLTFTTTDLHEVLTQSVMALKTHFGEGLNGVTLKTKYDSRIPSILGDGVQLKQSFLNIMTNALQAMPDGGQLIIETLGQNKANELRIKFADTGPGIPHEYMNKIFLPFFTLKKNRDRHGLGLSFAYQIIKNHEGNLSVENLPDGGAMFTVILPVKK